MTEPAHPSEGWSATWEAERARRLRGTLSATPAERLEWLEEAIEIAYRSGALPRKPEEPEVPSV